MLSHSNWKDEILTVLGFLMTSQQEPHKFEILIYFKRVNLWFSLSVLKYMIR